MNRQIAQIPVWTALSLMLLACDASPVSDDDHSPLATSAEAVIDSGVAAATEAQAHQANTVAVASDSSAPAMWQIDDEDSTLYLFGTVHLLPPDVRWKTPLYEAAMAEATTTITEADVESPESAAAMAGLMLKLGANPPGVKLSDVLGPERFSRFSALTSQLGMPAESMQPFRPWLAVITASVMAIQAEGFDPNSGVDKLITELAREQGDELAYFETAEEQIRILASLDEEEMLANFDVSLEQLENPQDMLLPMLEAWKAGDENRLDAVAAEELRTASPKAFDKLLVQRNANWANQVQQLLDGDGSYFIAVGAMHLVGEDSLIDLLEDRGIQARRIQ